MLTLQPDDRGSAVVESVFGMFVILFLALAAIQVALTLYARNVVISAVHEGARAAIEIGGSEVDAAAVAKRSIAGTSGSLVTDLEVDVAQTVTSERYVVRVTASGRLVAPGPIPVRIPVTTQATTSREILGEQR